MIQRIPADDRFSLDAGWLQAKWHFSFGHYTDRNNMHWGALRVFNDDVVQAGGGFDMHPHNDMEIISYIYEGGLKHQDSMGNEFTTTRGGVQVMSAGSGVMHAETNPGDVPVRLNQIWIFPRHKGSAPRWAQKNFDSSLNTGEWVPLVSDEGAIPGTLPIDQDAILSVARPEAGKSLSYPAREERYLYLFVGTGEVQIGETMFAEGDQARIHGESSLVVHANKASELLLLDLPE